MKEMMTDNRQAGLSKGLLLFIAISSGLTVANLYYNQPLLADICRSFGADPDEAGAISTCTQVGYALGMFLFVPLGDIKERRGFISMLLAMVALSLIGVAASQSLTWMYIASFAVGLTTIVPQVMIPMAATLAAPGEQGKAVGMVTSGLLLGILLSRTISGLIGGTWGWRVMYWIAAAAMLILLLLVRTKLPKSRPTAAIRYGSLLASMGSLVRKHATLRESALIGAANFAAFSIFWTALSFYLEGEPYNYSSQIAGLFGLIGAAGALGAPLVGRLADRIRPSLIIGALIVLNLLSYILFGTLGGYQAALITGVILMDLGVQGTQVANQTRIYALDPPARSRLNTVQMVTTFLGGAAGSWLGSYAWHRWGWSGVSLAGGGAVLFGFVVWASHRLSPRR
ncbi:MFS transporter [Cohnella lubricantis]|uniref:MFS transporter n=1 Tax=Cohnella lubricantis TaxID=2163172 RepID=A0A841TGM0_9BACL|nr:MFS transporter [Cohnella lubricantis]MBB6678380.1 MFS transporter [Cohnella lubricantis]MBP2116760.1 putative MFS family arabinose efflux permease [Cohnella lubricantis]